MPRRKSKKNTHRPNFCADAGVGCHVARADVDNDWVLDWERVDTEDYDADNVPDIAIDPEEQTLSLCNVGQVDKVAYLTVYDTRLQGRQGQWLEQGSTTDNNGHSQLCTTLIVLCPPLTFCHLCRIENLETFRLDSDVQDWHRHPQPSDAVDDQLAFPLEGGPFRCTQGVGGHLTHFFAGNLHAIDLACPPGTLLRAVADGTVVETKHDNCLTGIAVSNLFQWNSIMIRVHDNLFVEYVHIRKSLVQMGDTVVKGQVLGESGSVGFSPQPHLHLAAYRSAAPTAPTVQFCFQAENGTAFVPVAGQWYAAAEGLVQDYQATDQS